MYVYIYIHIYMNAEKNVFTKFIQVYTPSFLWDTLCHRGKRSRLTGYPSVPSCARRARDQSQVPEHRG